MGIAKKSKTDFIDIVNKNESNYVLDVYLYVKNRLTTDNEL